MPIVTRGDVTPGDLAAAGGKGLFTQELEAGLLAGHAVASPPAHSVRGASASGL